MKLPTTQRAIMKLSQQETFVGPTHHPRQPPTDNLLASYLHYGIVTFAPARCDVSLSFSSNH